MEKKRIATLFLIVLTDATGATAILPILPVYVLVQFHATPFQAALVIAMYYATQLLAAPWLGTLSDRFGRRPILLVSQAGTIISYLLIVFAAPLGTLLDHVGPQPGIAGGLIVMYLARLLDGATGGNVSVAQAYANDISTPEERTRALGLVGGASGLGHILGPALAGLLAGMTLLAPFMGAVAVSGVTLLLTFLWLQEPSHRLSSPDTMAKPTESVPLSQMLLRQPVILVLLTALLIGLYMAALSGIFSLYADRVLLVGQSSVVVVRIVGLLLAVLGLVMVLAQVVLLNPLVNHLGEKRAVVLSSLLLLASAVGFFTLSSPWGIGVVIVAFALGFGISWPTLQSLLTRSGSEQIAGRLLGAFQSAFSLALILGPIWSGYVFDAVSPRAVFLVSAGLMILAVLLSIGIQRQTLELASARSDNPLADTTEATRERKKGGHWVFRH